MLRMVVLVHGKGSYPVQVGCSSPVLVHGKGLHHLRTLESSPEDHVGCATKDMVLQMGTGQVDMPIQVLCSGLQTPYSLTPLYCIRCTLQMWSQ